MAGTISENLADVMDRVRKAARKAGRTPGEITLVAATKTVEVRRIKEAVAAGVRVFGENYVQEAAEKVKKVRDGSIAWHFIGHLQKNKVKAALELFDVIETVDTLSLATEINRRAKRPVDVFIEVNIAREKTKSGVSAAGAVKLARDISRLERLRLRGLMAMPPVSETSEGSRPYFVTLRRLAERINKERIPGVRIHELSMGMSADFDTAVEEGATIIRVGRAIFGERPEKAGKKAAPKPKKAAAKTKKPATKPKKAAPKPKKAAVKTKKAATKPAKSAAAKPKNKAAAKTAGKPARAGAPKTTRRK